MPLATSNLKVSDILTRLNVATPRAIFYIGGVLKTLSQLGELVNGSLLDATYCPGATSSDRLTYLLNNRKLSCFKGYLDNIVYELLLTPDNFTLDFLYAQLSFTVESTESWNVTTVADWITLETTSGTGNGTVNFSVSQNNEAFSRDAEIFVTTPNLSDAVTVYQNPQSKQL